MPIFARISWPGDHRDEVVAGALVSAVIVVLGYASGVGRGPAGGENFAVSPPPNSTVATSPAAVPAPSAVPPAGGGPVNTGAYPGTSTGYAGNGPPPFADPGSGGTGGGAGDPGTGPGPTSSAPPPGSSPPATTPGSPPPTTPGPGPTPCSDGEVHLLRPVGSLAVGTVSGVLDGLLGLGAAPSPSPSPSAASQAADGEAAGRAGTAATAGTAGTAGSSANGLLGGVCVPLPTSAPTSVVSP